jgi:hypothetical protein
MLNIYWEVFDFSLMVILLGVLEDPVDPEEDWKITVKF